MKEICTVAEQDQASFEIFFSFFVFSFRFLVYKILWGFLTSTGAYTASTHPVLLVIGRYCSYSTTAKVSVNIRSRTHFLRFKLHRNNESSNLRLH